MGTTQSCEDLLKYENPCKISNCVEGIIGLASSSASPTDTWILTMKNNVKYNNEPVTNVFMKIFINPTSIQQKENKFLSQYACVYKENHERRLDGNVVALKGLQYEVNVYSDVIRPLIDNNICPHFIKYIASSNHCTFDNLMDIIKPTLRKERKPSDYMLLRSVMYMRQNMAGRPKINEGVVNFDFLKQLNLFKPRVGLMTETINGKTNDILGRIGMPANTPYDELVFSQYLYDIQYNDFYSYGFLINESISDSTTTFYGFYRSQGSVLTDACVGVLFQVMIACYTMSLCHMAHNDIHVENVMVEKLSEPRNFNYVINGVLYSLLNQHYIAKVYDFDHAYVESIGNNVLIGNNNVHIPSKDQIQFLAYMIEKGHNLLSLCIRDIAHHRDWLLICESSLFPMSKEKYNELYSPIEIINNFANQYHSFITKQTFFDVSTIDQPYIIDDRMFGVNGSLLKTVPVGGELALLSEIKSLKNELAQLQIDCGQNLSNTSNKRQRRTSNTMSIEPTTNTSRKRPLH